MDDTTDTLFENGEWTAEANSLSNWPAGTSWVEDTEFRQMQTKNDKLKAKVENQRAAILDHERTSGDLRAKLAKLQRRADALEKKTAPALVQQLQLRDSELAKANDVNKHLRTIIAEGNERETDLMRALGEHECLNKYRDAPMFDDECTCKHCQRKSSSSIRGDKAAIDYSLVPAPSPLAG